jgi:carboxymethylenebutenolidase
MPDLIEVPFPRGNCPIHTFGALDNEAAPVVLIFMDAFCPRPVLFEIAERLVGEGYRVLMPHLFYEHVPVAPIDFNQIFSGGPDRDRLFKMLGGLDMATVKADVGALLDFVGERLGTEAPIGTTGYCMGGRFALTAATLSDRVRFAGAFHAAGLAPEQGDSVHHDFEGVRAQLYIGVAGIDPMFGGAEEGRLAQALRDADTDHVIETYANAAHGYVMSDLPAYNAAASARHWDNLSGRLRYCFAQG